MTEQEKHVIRCAFADLCGALQDYQQRGGDSFHDYESHRVTIQDMAETFPFVGELPEDCK